MLAYLLDHMERSPSRLRPFYGLRASDVDRRRRRVTVRRALRARRDRRDAHVRARYVVGCDGARSARALGDRPRARRRRDRRGLGCDGRPRRHRLPGHPRQVRDQVRRHGNILIIPREGGYLVRLYIELDASDASTSASVTPEKLTEVAEPHPAPVHASRSKTSAGGRSTRSASDCATRSTTCRRAAAPRVFIAGDACHTHSAKAGQGMNVSMADAWNLGWKLAAVLRGTARPELLHTYSQERHAVAQELIDFDREFSKLFRGRAGRRPGGVPALLRRAGPLHGGRRDPIRAVHDHRRSAVQHLATGFPVGMRFHSAPVIRLADAKPMHLGHVARADGAWRLYVFADRERSRAARAVRVPGVERRRSGASRPRAPSPTPSSTSAPCSSRATASWPSTRLPPVLLPRKGRFGLIDYEKVFCPDPRPATSSTCAASIATRAAWSSSARTSTSRTCSLCTSTRRWRLLRRNPAHIVPAASSKVIWT